MRSAARTLWVALTCAAAVSACQPDGPRQLAYPDFDPRAPFPELASVAAEPGAGGDTTDPPPRTAYERAVQEALAGDGGAEAADAEATTAAETVRRQQVRVGGLLVSEVPQNYDEWRWATDGRVTLIAYARPGSPQPQALIYAERYTPLIDRLPSFELVRFQRTVDPALAPDLVPPQLTETAVRQLAGRTNLPAHQLSNTLADGASRTMGLGLGYRSGRDSFTGTRWVGHNDHRIDLRFGRTTGTWSSGDTAGAEAFAEALGRVGLPGTEALRAEAARAAQRGAATEPSGVAGTGDGAASTGARSAYMLVGAASVGGEHGGDQGVHVAVLCEASPRCEVAGALADFLAGLRQAPAGEAGSPDQALTLDALAAELGIPLASQEATLAPTELDALLDQVHTPPR